MLNAAALGVFVLRRRVQRLLVATETLSRQDPLTGLFNRRYLVEQAPRMWRQARREGTRVAAMVLDLDHFKRLNDEYGHAAGDAVLRAVASSLTGDRAARRRPGPHRRRGTRRPRPRRATRRGGARLAERLRDAVAGSPHRRRPHRDRLGRHRVTRPATARTPADALWRLVDRADAAMYQAKRRAGTGWPWPMWAPAACSAARRRPRSGSPGTTTALGGGAQSPVPTRASSAGRDAPFSASLAP